LDFGVELEDSIMDMLSINSDDHPVVSMNLWVIMGSNDPSNQSKQADPQLSSIDEWLVDVKSVFYFHWNQLLFNKMTVHSVQTPNRPKRVKMEQILI
jgi:hypothetical protein